MTKKLPLLFSLVSAISLAGLTVYQSEVISDLRVQLTKTFQKLSNTEEALNAETLRAEELSVEITLLRDSVSFLNSRVLELSTKIHGLKSTIVNLNEVIRKKEDKVAAITKQIEKLSNENKANKDIIKNLEQERDALLNRMHVLDSHRETVRVDKAKTEQIRNEQTNVVKELESNISQKEQIISNPIMDAPIPVPNWKIADANTPPAPPNEPSTGIKTDEGNKMKNIVYNTKVNFQKVIVKNRENGNEIRKAKDDWKYVYLQVTLENQDPKLLIGEEFMVSVMDKDQGRLVPFNENNPVFPDSAQGVEGFKLKFEGNPIQIKYYNHQKKESSNYEIRVFYSRNNLIFPLTNGTQQFIQNGEVITR